MLYTMMRCYLLVAVLNLTDYLHFGVTQTIPLGKALLLGTLGEFVWIECRYYVVRRELEQAKTNNRGG